MPIPESPQARSLFGRASLGQSSQGRSAQARSPQEKIDTYLGELRSRLRSLPKEHAADIVEEIRSHILDSAGGPAGMTDASVSAALSRLGLPAVLAASYATDNLLAQAENHRMPWSVLRGAFRWARLSVTGVLVFLVCLFGYGLGGSFFIAALAKPLNPNVGLWLIDQDNYSLVLGMTAGISRGHELLGWKLIPIGLALGGGMLMLTTHFWLWCVRQFRQTRSSKPLRAAVQ